jgi:chromosome segregation ATPase
MTKSGAAQAQPELKAEHVSDPKRIQSVESERVEGLLEEIRVVKEKHALELDAILGSLGRSKSESKELKEEVDRLTESLHQVETERDEYRSLVGDLESRIKDLEAGEPSTSRTS